MGTLECLGGGDGFGQRATPQIHDFFTGFRLEAIAKAIDLVHGAHLTNMSHASTKLADIALDRTTLAASFKFGL